MSAAEGGVSTTPQTGLTESAPAVDDVHEPEDAAAAHPSEPAATSG